MTKAIGPLPQLVAWLTPKLNTELAVTMATTFWQACFSKFSFTFLEYFSILLLVLGLHVIPINNEPSTKGLSLCPWWKWQNVWAWVHHYMLVNSFTKFIMISGFVQKVVLCRSGFVQKNYGKLQNIYTQNNVLSASDVSGISTNLNLKTSINQ